MVTLHPNFRQTIKTHIDQRVRAAYAEMLRRGARQDGCRTPSRRSVPRRK
jgi:hypothetical protein